MPALSVSEALARAALIEVDSYDISLDLTATPVTSRTDVRFRCRQPGSETFADLSVATTRSAVLNGEPAGQPEDGRLRLAGLRADNVLTVEADIAADTFSRFTDPADGAEYLHVMTYPVDAALLMGCFDQPDLGATVTMTVRVPEGWGCYANGPVINVPEDEGEWRFAPVPGLEPYLLVLCAGPFAMRPGNGSSPGIGRRRSLTRVDASLDGFAAVAAQALRHYEELLGVPSPYPKYDIFFIPGLQAHAVSVPGLMLVNENLLTRMTDPDDDFTAMLCWHEVAHLWFGSHVTMRWWDDLWLDEAMATYLSHTQRWAEFGYRFKADAYRADGLPSRQPVSSPVATSADALSRPFALTYSKGAAVIRQLGAVIGEKAMNAGMNDYLTRFGGSTAALDDLVGCWSRASGRDLAGWADEWLRAPGASVLRPEVEVTAEGVIDSLAVVQEEGSRSHVIGIGLYDLNGDGQLRRRTLVSAEVKGERTIVPALAGEAAPDALVLNDGDLGYARVRFDPLSQRVLAAAALDVGDPDTEAVCWNAFWEMVTSASLAAADFADLVSRRLASAATLPAAAVETLIERAVQAADVWAHPALRPQLRERLAEAVQAADSPALARGFAAAAHSPAQLATLRTWLGGPLEADLRARVMYTLAAQGLADDAEIDALATLDPVAGEANRATCLAMRPSAEAKAAAWAAALSPTATSGLAEAHARGIWVAGQESVLGGLDYFGVALPSLTRRDARTQRRLGRQLFPATLVSQATIEAAEAWLAAADGPAALQVAVAEQTAVMRAVLAARRLAV